MMIRRFGRRSGLTGVAVRAALTALLAFRFVIIPAVASATPVSQTDPNLLPVCTIYGLYYIDLRTGEKIPADDQDGQNSAKKDDCTACHFGCKTSALAPRDAIGDLAPLVRADRGAHSDNQVLRHQVLNWRLQSRGPPLA